ncbi:MAG: HAD family hydrolase, partial [Candidatus Liptonbacteria bacterium]
MNKAVFLDRDGVINELVKGQEMHSFILTKESCLPIPGAKEALRKIRDKGYLRIVVTNQPAIARGLVSPEEVDSLHQFLNDKLDNLIDRFYTCPHHPEMHPDVPEHAKKYRIPCDCRKPGSGMLFRAAQDFDIDLKKSFMIGDMITDIAAGAGAGCQTMMIESPAN